MAIFAVIAIHLKPNRIQDIENGGTEMETERWAAIDSDRRRDQDRGRMPGNRRMVQDETRLEQDRLMTGKEIDD